MAAWTIVAVPLLIMFFALGMERVESRLSHGRVGENDVAEFLDEARPSEVRALFRDGISRALELFRLRRRSPRAAQPTRHAITARRSVPRPHGSPVRRGPAAAVTATATADDAVDEARSRAS
jgi:hypothetical protein